MLTSSTLSRVSRELGPLLSPERIALIGSLSKQSGLGARTMRHLEATGFQGEVTALKSAADLTGDVDIAVVAVPSAVAPQVVAELDGRAAFVVVYTSGFEEVGAPALPATQHGTVVIGPNSAGLFSGPGRAAVTFANAFDAPMTCPPGSGIFLIAQSGAFGARMVDTADTYGVAFDGFVAVGNGTYYDSCDIALDLLASDVHRPRVLALYLESVPDGAKLDSVLLAARAVDVPVVVLCGGVSEVGATAARSHTAAVSPDGAVLRELCLLRGAFFAQSDRELVEAAVGLSVLGASRGRRVGIVTGSGGAGVVSTDLLAERGLTVPALSGEVQSRLAERLPDFASTVNPVDVTASVVPDTGVICHVTAALAASGEVDSILVVGQAGHAARVRAAAGGAVPVAFGLLEGAPSLAAPYLREGHPVFAGLEATCTILAASAAVGRWDAEAQRASPVATPHSGPRDIDTAQSLELVTAAGASVAPWRRASSAAEVLAAGDELGWPVVVKANLPAGAHKALRGGVRLGVHAEDAEHVATELLAMAPSLVVAAQLAGGLELVVGVRRDPSLGRVIVAGLGGGHVELIDRVVSVPATVSAHWLAERLWETVFARGGNRYAELVTQLAEVAGALVECAESGGFDLVECNPLLATADGLVAVDARVIADA